MTSESNLAPRTRRTLFIADGQLRPVWQLALYPLIVVVLGAIVSPVADILLRALASAAGVQEGDSYTTAVLVLHTIRVGVQAAAILVGTWLWQRFVRRRDMADLGLGLRRGWLGQLGLGVLVAIGLTGFIFMIELLAGWVTVEDWAWQLRGGREALAVLYVVMVNMALVAVQEEVIIRGGVLQALEGWIGLRGAVLISSALFGLLHLINPTAGGWADVRRRLSVTTLAVGRHRVALGVERVRVWRLWPGLRGGRPGVGAGDRGDGPGLLGRSARYVLWPRGGCARRARHAAGHRVLLVGAASGPGHRGGGVIGHQV